MRNLVGFVPGEQAIGGISFRVQTPAQKTAVQADDRSEHDASGDEAPSSTELRTRAESEVQALFGFVEMAAGARDYEGFEHELIARMFELGRLLVALFLCLWGERLEVPGTCRRGGAKYRRQPPKHRLLGTFFGKVRYWRAYMHQTNGRGGGFYPLDDRLELSGDGFSFGVLGRAVQLATKMSFSASVLVMRSFLAWSPCTKTIEEAVLGMGRYTAVWFEEQGPPPDDGEVLVAQIDSKATPTALKQELEKRRGKRRPNPYPDSPRHRGRAKRKHRGKKKRRKKGDKSKNGKMATILVMYTLKPGTDEHGRPILRGPINRRIYASYAPKRHVFAIARREANKRGFTPDSGKTIQIVTDGDEDLERGVREFFPEAKHTLDIIHAIEYLWKAGACIYPEASQHLTDWVEEQKDRLYKGRITDLMIEGEEALRTIKSSKKRKRCDKILDYFAKRVHMMNYGELARLDLEIGSGIVEGAVRYVIAQRFDEGGMRWIKERAEALLQLRCIEINGDWDNFVSFAHRRLLEESRALGRHKRLLQDTPEPLPTYGLNS